MKRLLAESLQELRGRIAAACEKYNRDTDDIAIVAITKTHPAQIIRTAVAAGLHDIGESRVQEAEAKITEVGRIARFHMVGHLQSNKVKKAVRLFDVIQSVDSLRLAEEIDRQSGPAGLRPECLVEVNCSGETQKSGIAPDSCLELVRRVQALPNIRVVGLMTVGPLTRDDAAIRAAFARCRELYRQAREFVGNDFDTLSMGMSDDFELAIAEGATMIRIGTALFGSRD